ncbi:MAG: glutathione S-transferase C-terminal domain-containing protein, partial [Neisseriaceae bacterium]|nr:glutathione S-transferase C-terminal domain-containing protein [Neisseriaceae bacterium]
VQTLENLNASEEEKDAARFAIRERVTYMSALFAKNNKYILGNNFSMVDVAIAPLLWRLDHYGIQLDNSAAGILKYGERLFSRPAFIDALTPSEKAMRR